MNDQTIIIGDFGASAQFKQNCATFVGTAVYMAPEMTTAFHNQGSYNSKVDLWSVGVGYYKLLFGKFPFGSGCEINQDIQANSGDKLKFHDSINNISEYSRDLLKKMLHKDPEQRISWEAFFEHELFTVPVEKLRPKGSEAQFTLAIKNNTQVNDLFNKSRVEALEFDPKKKEGALLPNLVKNIVILKMNEESIEINDAQKEDIQLLETMNDNTNRYNFEKTKILHIWYTLDKLRDLCSIIPGHPQIYIIDFLNLLICMKGWVFSDISVQTIEKKQNMFQLKHFDEWCISQDAKSILAQHRQNCVGYEQRFNFYKNICSANNSIILNTHLANEELMFTLNSNKLAKVSQLAEPIKHCFHFLATMMSDPNIINYPEVKLVLGKAIVYSNYTTELPIKWPYKKGNTYD